MPRRCRPRLGRSGRVSNDAPARPVRGRTPRGPGLRVTGALRAVGNILRGVVASRGWRLASAGPCETRRTPGSAAGCNKPASRCAEKPGEVVRNHEVGTRLPDGIRRPMVMGLTHGREWTRGRSFARRCKADGGAIGPGVRCKPGIGPTPREETGVSRSGQQAGAPEGSRRVGR
jgi:hypothetical protein